jgi:hypothetical protein
MPGYISEFQYFGDSDVEFIEIAVPTGTDVSAYSVVVYNEDGTVHGTFGLGGLQSTNGGNDVYLINDSTPGWLAADTGFQGTLDGNAAIALVDDTSTVLQFTSYATSYEGSFTATEGPAAGMTSVDAGNAGPGKSLQSDDGGNSYYVQNTPNAGAIPCYAPGTMIDTPDGPQAVETLKVGDLVMTLDHGPQPIRWVHSGDQPLEAAEVDAKPVLIAAGALGPGLPAQDLIVSPQHRILVGGHRQLQGRFKTEAFAPAKSLTRLPGIRHMKGKTTITWIHFACDRHEIVTANGCLSESLLLGPMVVKGLTAAERQAVIDIFGPAPTPDAALNGPPALECLKVGVARRQLAKCSEDQEKLVAQEIKKWDVDLAMEKYESERLREAKAMNEVRMKKVA